MADDLNTRAVEAVVSDATTIPRWRFLPNAPEQCTSAGDFDGLDEGYIRPEAVLHPDDAARVRAAQSLLRSFFAALRDAGLRPEM